MASRPTPTCGSSVEARAPLANPGRNRSRHARPGVEPFIELKIALLGETAALNCAAAIAGVAAMHPRPLEWRELAAIADALAVVKPVAGRLANTSIHGIFVIDDTYNSNPRSIRAASRPRAR